MKAKGKARKIFKNLRQKKLNELLNNETQSDEIKYLDNQIESEVKTPEKPKKDFKKIAIGKTKDFFKENVLTGVDSKSDLKSFLKDKSSSIGIGLGLTSYGISKAYTAFNNLRNREPEQLNQIEPEVETPNNDINETLNDFKDDNSTQFKKQSKQLRKIDSKLDKFEQKIFHSQGGEKTALPTKNQSIFGKTKDFFTKHFSNDYSSENKPTFVDNNSNLIGIGLGLATWAGGTALTALKNWWNNNDNIETQSVDDKKTIESNSIETKSIEGKVKQYEYTPPTKREIEQVRDDNLLSEIIEAENNGSETPSYLKEKKSFLSYIPFLKTKPTYELSDEFKERLSDDENYLETKKHLLAKLKTRDDVKKYDLEFLENQIIQTAEKRKERDTKVHYFGTKDFVSIAEIEEAFPEYKEKYERLSNDYRLNEVIRNKTINNLDNFYTKKYILLKDPSKALVKNYYGEVLSPREYLHDSEFIEPYLNEYKTETELLDEDPEVNEKKLDEIEANSKSRYDEIQNQQKFLNELRQKSAEKETLKLDKEATINSPKPETTQSVDDSKTIETNSLDTTNLKPIQPTPEKPKPIENIEGSVKPANISGNETVSQSEANITDNQDKKEQEATTSSPTSVSTPSVSSPSQSTPASVTQSAPQSPQVQLSNNSKNLAEKTIGTEPKPDTITNEKVINNEVIQKTPENNFNKFNKAQLNEDEDKFLKGE